jgi:tetratricopeptide (TPR) repeat protein
MNERLAIALACGLVVACRSTPSQRLTTNAAEPPVLLSRGEPRPSIPPSPPSVRELAKGAMLFDDLGTLTRPVTTSSPSAQRYFDQGLRLTYAFNHDEATRSFAMAAEIDPACAMCFWGVALTLGPNYNVPMLPARAKAAWEALERAKLLAPRTTPVELALVSALTTRYKGQDPLDPVAMHPFNVAYADAMRTIAKSFPDDLDVQVLFAEATMDINPWKLWTLDGKPSEGTEETVSTLERVIAREPNHPGANHYYIHAVEASPHPEKALPSAERLPGLIPGAGHIVHMPAHIFQRVGRYADASTANERAVRVDLAYMQKTTPPGYYPMYLGHNYGFLAFSSSMEGRSAVSLEAARHASKAMPPGMIDMMPGMDFFVAEPLLTMVRFGKWDDLLAEPRPDPKYPVLTGFWLHGHGMALAAKGRTTEALAHRDELLKLAAAVPPELLAGQSSAKDVLGLAAKVIEARVATLQKRKDSLALWAEAVDLADKLAYAEPDDWFYPVRHYQGAALLSAGKAKEAEAVYREDLRRHPHNGWALFGLSKSLAAQKKTAEAAAVNDEFDAAWKNADFKLASTAF